MLIIKKQQLGLFISFLLKIAVSKLLTLKNIVLIVCQDMRKGLDCKKLNWIAGHAVPFAITEVAEKTDGEKYAHLINCESVNN